MVNRYHINTLALTEEGVPAEPSPAQEMLQSARANNLPRQLETIIEAYEEFSPFNTDEIALIEPLRAMRLVY
jgi:hypothetical protein